MTELRICGADPGLTTGIAASCWEDGKLKFAHVFQCDGPSAPDLLHFVLSFYGPFDGGGIEAFIPGAHSGRGEGTFTRLLVAELGTIAAGYELELRERRATDVKPWATSARLTAAGLLALCPGMPHAADACRHLLFCACHDWGLADPLSRGRAS